MRTPGLKAAVIGAGEAGQAHIDALVRRADLELLVICDPDECTRNRVTKCLDAREFDRFQIFDDWHRGLSLCRYDLIVVASPEVSHFSQILEGLDQGAAVVVETPVVNEWIEWEQLTRLSDRTSCRLFISAPWRKGQQRFQPQSKDWQLSWESGNGVLGREGWQVLDEALGGLNLGLPRRVFAAGDGAPFGVPSSCTPMELLATMEFDQCSSLTWQERVHGRNISVRGLDGRTIQAVGEKNLKNIDLYGETSPLDDMWESILAEVRNGEPSAFKFAKNCKVAPAWLAIKEALKTQRNLVFDWNGSNFNHTLV